MSSVNVPPGMAFGADDERRFREELERRARLSAAENLRLRHVQADPYNAVKSGYIYTVDEKRAGQVLLMPDIPYLEIVTRITQLFPVVLILKSRQLMMTWLFCWLALHEALYSPNSLTVLQGKRLEDVKAKGDKGLMGRVLTIYRRLPWFLKPSYWRLVREQINPGKPKREDTTTSLQIGGGGVLMSAPEGPDIVRSRTITKMLMDELTFHQHGKQAWDAAVPTIDNAEPMAWTPPPWLESWNERMAKRCPDLVVDPTQPRPRASIAGVSTPNGEDPVMYGKAPWEEWEPWPELTGYEYDDNLGPVEGLRVYIHKREAEGYVLPPIVCVRLHYTAEYRPIAWARRRASISTYSSIAAYEQENEIRFRSFAGLPVFGEKHFKFLHLQRYQVDPRRPTLVSTDTGYQGQSACFWQESTVRVGNIWWRRSHLFFHRLEKECTLDRAIDLYKQDLWRYGIDWRTVRWITDYNTLVSHQGGTGITDMQIFAEHGIDPEARHVGPNQKSQLLGLARKALMVWPDGRSGVEIDPVGAPKVVRMLDGGWRYKEPQVGEGPKEEPAKDGTYDHIGDSFCYRFWRCSSEIWNTTIPIVFDRPTPEVTYYYKDAFLKRRGASAKRKTRRTGPGPAF